MKKPGNLTLICGDEEYLKEQKKQELLEALTAPGSMNFNAFSGADTDPAEVGRLAGTMPFFEDHRTILLTDTGWFKGTAPEAVLQAFEEIPASTYIIVKEKEADAGNALYKQFKKAGDIARFTAVESKKGREVSDARSQVRSWIRDRLRENGRSIDSQVLNNLVELTGYDMQNLSTELEKLLCYCMDRPKGARITQDDVDAICSRTLSDRVFDMLGQKLAGHTGRAVGMLEELFAMKVPAMRILYLIVRQYNQAYMLKDLQREGFSDAQIMDRMQVPDWLLRKLKDQTARLSAAELERSLELCAQMEMKTKSGDMPERLAVELILTD